MKSASRLRPGQDAEGRVTVTPSTSARPPIEDIDDQANYDDAELEASGYHREMPRQFSTFSLLALSYAVICTWNGFASAIGNGIKQGSSAGSIFMLFPAALFIGIVSLGMAELTSAFPVAGGQYYWAFILSPPKWGPFISYSTAVTSVLGIWLGGASTSNFISGMVLSIVQFINPDYTIDPWHKYLVYVAIMVLGATINILGARKLPALTGFIFVFSMATLVVTTITMLFCSYPNYNLARWVFTDNTISSGWESHSLAWVLCFVNNLYGFLGTDAGVHMTEEIPNPTVTAPKVIIYPVIIGLATVFPFACTCMFVIKDIDEILNAPSGLPLIQLYYQATDSRVITVLLMVAFAAAFSIVYGLVFVGSETAFELMVSASIIFLVGSYVIPQAILLFVDRHELLPERPFSLGRFGYAVNFISTIWTVLLHCGIVVVLLDLVRVGVFEKGCLPRAKHRQSYARVKETKAFTRVYSRCANPAA
ncbi:amino acid permease [Colletotrichum gloeosporioides Cg-14]|uniref:Amino acid permease n=1 Tax=Colletotrichum gloeosporioides (strain Cg-14) TaxID=1237896 RepID=T0M2C4_COLGC|nr:amino acid permease [Colletotrichum gloeosporioides Cg-14]